MRILDALTIEDLRLIVAIADEGSLTAGAAKTRMSQSNASYSLKKIQTAFQTNLFIREGRKLVPCEFGWHVYTQAQAMLEILKSIMHPPEFDPSQEFTLHFAATEYDLAALFPHIRKLLDQYAPKAILQISALDSSDTYGQLASFDFIFVPVDITSPKVQTLCVFSDNVVVFFDKSKRCAPATLKEYANARHAIASFDGKMTTYTDHLLALKGLTRTVAVAAFGFGAVAILMRGTDLITTMPKRLENTLFADFSQSPVPIKDDLVSLYMCWEAAKEERGKIRWFADLLRDNPL